MLDTKLLLTVGVGLAVVAILILIVIKLYKGRQERTKAVKSNHLAGDLRNERLKSDVILNGIDDGVILIDEQETIQLINPGASNVSGWKIDEAKGLNFKSVLRFVNDKGEPYTESQDPVMRCFREADTIRDNTANLLSKSNKAVAVNLTASPLFDRGKAITGAVIMLSDVSQQRKEEKQRAEFISTASHEMRTPVAAIEGYLALALNDKVSTIDHRARGYIEKAHQSTQHLGKLFQDLLTSAKAEDGRLSNHPVVVDIGEMLEELTEDLKFTAEKKGLLMEFTLGDSGKTINAAEGSGKSVRPLYYVQADPERLREVITNLFDNATKYTESGKITIGLTGDENVVQFFVRDTGHGIPGEDAPHLFEKFYRVDSSATRTIGGTGLGLFICRKIIELYSGRIWVVSELEKGSTFYINLPRLSTQKAEQLKAEETNENQVSATANLSNA